jgi:hypothetical protein
MVSYRVEVLVTSTVEMPSLPCETEAAVVEEADATALDVTLPEAEEEKEELAAAQLLLTARRTGATLLTTAGSRGRMEASTSLAETK